MTVDGTRAYRIVTDRLVIRCWDPADAVLFKEAIDSSLDHLRPWMPWAEAEPTALEQKADLLRSFAGQFARGEDAVYGLFDAAEERVLGSTGLHPRLGAGAREIGYWIRADAIGQGLASESTAALTRVGFEVDGLRRIEIHCDAANVRSAAVPRRLGYWIRADAIGQGLASESTAALTRVGFEVDGLRRIEIHCDAANVRSAAIPRKLGYTDTGARDGRGHLVFRIERSEYPGSPSVAAALTAYDSTGARLT